MGMPGRITRQAGRYALVDGIPFQLPVRSADSPALMAAFSVDAEKAARLLPGDEVFPFRLWDRGLLLITVVDYRVTNIGKYVEFSVGIVCTHGALPAPRLLPALLPSVYGIGQYVFDLPVSTEISVKGGKGIWGMPKHQANLDFRIGDDLVSSQYDLDGQFAMKVEVRRPARAWLPMRLAAANYCEFRGMLMKSSVYFRGKLGFSLFKPGSARLILGDHPRVRPLRDLDIRPDPVFAGFFPATEGVLDDHFESWFISSTQPPAIPPEGLESVVDLGQGEDWLPPPGAPVPGEAAPSDVET